MTSSAAQRSARLGAPGRAFADALTALSALALAALLALTLRLGDPALLVPVVLAAAFAVAGAGGARARPDHRGIRLLLLVGALHLAGYALAGWAGAGEGVPRAVAWLAAVVGDGAYLAGFVVLALLVATYPTGVVRTTGARLLAAIGAAATAAVFLLEVLGHPRLGLVIDSRVESVPAPFALPDTSLSLVGLVPLLVVAALAVLWRSAARLAPAERAALGWAKLGCAVLAIMLVATPAATTVLPAGCWDIAFVVIVGTLPFVLLAGLARFRLLEVELYLARTVARGVVGVCVLFAFAAADVLFGRAGLGYVAVPVTLLAAWGGMPLIRRLEGYADRVFAGGRARRGAAMHQLGRALAAVGDDPAAHACRAIADGMEAAWARITVAGGVTARVPADAGAADGDVETAGPPHASVALEVGGERVGALECGPRRGGWGPGELAQLEELAGPVALAVRGTELTRQLAARVDELSASRRRLVHAEETARRALERDLHDGLQQELLALLARLNLATRALPAGSAAAAPLTAALEAAQRSVRSLRELVSGIRPPVLGDLGLAAAVEARAATMPLPAALDIDPCVADERFGPDIEAAAYFVVCEALANTIKHAGSDHARIVLGALPEGGLRVAVADDGNGEADASRGGTGLAGLRDRVEALGGRFEVRAVAGVGTTVVAEFRRAVEPAAPATPARPAQAAKAQAASDD